MRGENFESGDSQRRLNHFSKNLQMKLSDDDAVKKK